jgi:hypothetical protein
MTAMPDPVTPTPEALAAAEQALRGLVHAYGDRLIEGWATELDRFAEQRVAAALPRAGSDTTTLLLVKLDVAHKVIEALKAALAAQEHIPENTNKINALWEEVDRTLAAYYAERGDPD